MPKNTLQVERCKIINEIEKWEPLSRFFLLKRRFPSKSQMLQSTKLLEPDYKHEIVLDEERWEELDMGKPNISSKEYKKQKKGIRSIKR